MAYHDVIMAEEKYKVAVPVATTDSHDYTSVYHSSAEVCINHLKYLVKKKRILTET
jgi:hypothetical protein